MSDLSPQSTPNPRLDQALPLGRPSALRGWTA
jgi:hypothetical protein